MCAEFQARMKYDATGYPNDPGFQTYGTISTGDITQQIGHLHYLSILALSS